MAGDAFTIGLLFFFGFLALAGAILTILRFWLVEGTLDGALALALLSGVLFFAVAAIRSASPLLIVLSIVILIAGTVGVPALSARSEKQAIRNLQIEDVAKYRRALEANPQNWVAWREIGEVFMKMNHYDQAISAYKEAIRLNPPDVERVRRRLNAAIEYRAGMPRVETIVCDRCGKETPKAKTCLHCGAGLELTFLDWLLQRDTLLNVVRPAIALLAGGIATLVLFSNIGTVGKASIIVTCAVVGGYFVWRIVQES